MTTLTRSKTKAYSRRYDKLRRNGIHMTVDGTITRRKLAALWALGHSLTDIAKDMGRTQQSLSATLHSTSPVHRTTERLVSEAYARLYLTRPQGRDAEWVRGQARKWGAAPPLAYDDITDPSEQPKGLRR